MLKKCFKDIIYKTKKKRNCVKNAS